MKQINPAELGPKELHQYVLGAVAPRPIALVSTIDAQGRRNLAPFSFFNAVSSNPPVFMLSVNLRVPDGAAKDTLRNCRETGEAVIHVVNKRILRQTAVAGLDFPPDADEFTLTGLTPIPATIVGPAIVAESPVAIECVVERIVELGDHPGAANVVFLRAVMFHFDAETLDEKGRPNPEKLRLIGRMGKLWYAETGAENLIEVIPPKNEDIDLFLRGEI